MVGDGYYVINSRGLSTTTLEAVDMSSSGPSPSFHEAASYLSNAPALSKLSNGAKLEVHDSCLCFHIVPDARIALSCMAYSSF